MPELTGPIKEIFDTQEVSPTFSKREFVVEDRENPNYPQPIKLELVKDKCDLLDKYKVGQEVKVSYNLRGRAWTNAEGRTQYFNTVQAWRIEALEGGNNVVTPKEKEAPSWMHANKPVATGFEPGPGEDDLPF